MEDSEDKKKFHHPSFSIEKINDLKELKIKLKEEQLILGSKISFFHVSKLKQKERIFIRGHCRFCSAKFRLQWSGLEQKYTCLVNDNYHIHAHKIDELSENERIMAFIKKLLGEKEKNEVKELVLSTFFIHERKYYRMVRKIKNEHSYLCQMKKNSFFNSQFNVKKVYINQDCKEAILPQDLEVYWIQKEKWEMNKKQKFSDHCYCKILQAKIEMKLVSNTSVTQTWYVMILMGKNNANQTEIFAVYAMNAREGSVLKGIILNYLKAVLKISVMIIDYEEDLIQILDQMKQKGEFDGHYLIDCESVKNQLLGKLYDKKLKKLLAKSLTERSGDKLQKMKCFAVNLEDKIEWDKQIVQKFLKLTPKCCIAETPSVFHSLNGESTHFSHQFNFNEHLKSVSIQIGLQKIVNHIESTLNQTSRNWTEVEGKGLMERWLLQKYSSQVVRKLLQNYTNVSKTKIYQQGNPRTFYVSDESYEDAKIKQKNDGIFECSCRATEKTGLPCSHILKICKEKEIDPNMYVAERWKKTSDQIELEQHQKMKKNGENQKKRRKYPEGRRKTLGK